MAAIDNAYEWLDEPTQQAYRDLLHYPGVDLTRESAAAAIGGERAAALDRVDALRRHGLLTPGREGRLALPLQVREMGQSQRTGAPAGKMVVVRGVSYFHELLYRAAYEVQPREGLSHTLESPREDFTFTGRVPALDTVEFHLGEITELGKAALAHGLHVEIGWLFDCLQRVFLVRKLFPWWKKWCELAVAAAQACGDYAALARAYHHGALYFNNQRDREQCLTWAMASLDAARKAPAEMRAEVEAMALSVNGLAHRGQGDTELALIFFRNAVERCADAGRNRDVALNRRRLGQAYLDTENYTQAVHELTSSYTLLALDGDDLPAAVTGIWLSNAYTASGDPQTGRSIAEKILPTLKESGSKQFYAQGLMMLAEAALALGDDATAGEFSAESVDLWEEMGLDPSRAQRTLDRATGGPTPQDGDRA